MLLITPNEACLVAGPPFVRRSSGAGTRLIADGSETTSARRLEDVDRRAGRHPGSAGSMRKSSSMRQPRASRIPDRPAAAGHGERSSSGSGRLRPRLRHRPSPEVMRPTGDPLEGERRRAEIVNDPDVRFWHVRPLRRWWPCTPVTGRPHRVVAAGGRVRCTAASSDRSSDSGVGGCTRPSTSCAIAAGHVHRCRCTALCGDQRAAAAMQPHDQTPRTSEHSGGKHLHLRTLKPGIRRPALAVSWSNAHYHWLSARSGKAAIAGASTLKKPIRWDQTKASDNRTNRLRQSD